MEEDQLHINESLIISYLIGDALSDEQRTVVEEWLEDERNHEEAREIYQSWELSQLVSTERTDADKAFKKVAGKLFPQEGNKTRIIPIRWKIAVAAAVSLFILGTALWKFSDQEEVKQVLASTVESNNYTLADSSKISLNKQSTLTYYQERFQKSSTREVWLQGEAFFEVEAQPERPFIVHTIDATITVIGTKFLVKKELNSPTHVLVTEGRVQVVYSESEEKVFLNAAEEVTIAQEENKPEVSSSNVNELYWKTGVMTFENKSLKDVLHTLSDEFNIFVDVKNESILSCKLTATFKKQSLETIIKVIETTHDLECHLSSDTLRINGNGCL
ncbi:MAG: FecR domain-containing protein [Bacteroidota bacterium]